MESKVHYLGTYGRYDWGTNMSSSYIHPDDISMARSEFIAGNVFHCIAQDEKYITLQYGQLVLRVKPSLYTLVPNVLFNIGDRVHIKGKPDDVVGVVLDIIWHFDRAQPMYFLRVNGRKKSRRYYDDELVKINE